MDKYIKKFPSYHGKQESVYAYPEGGYCYIHGCHCIITDIEPPFKALATGDHNAKKILATMTKPIEIPTIKELKKSKEDKVELAEHVLFSRQYLIDLLSVLGDCKAYWNGTVHNSSGFWTDGLRLVSDKGEALLCGIRA